MANAAIAQAYLSVIPSMSGFSNAISKEMTTGVSGASSVMTKAGGIAGNAFSTAFSPGILKLVGIGAIFAGVVKGGEDFHKAVATISGTTGKTGQALNDFAEIARKTSIDTGQNVADLADRMSNFRTKIGGSDAEIANLSKTFGQLNKITDGNAGSIEEISRTINIFGMSASDGSKMMKGLFDISQRTGVSVGTLTGALNTNGEALRNSGFDALQASGVYAILSKDTSIADQALTGLGKSLPKLAQKMGVSAPEAYTASLQKLKESGLNSSDALKTLTDLFGARVGGKMLEDLKQGTISLDDLANGMGEVDTSGQKLNDALTASATPLDRLNKIMNIFAQSESPAFNGALDTIADGLNTAFKWLDEHQEVADVLVKTALGLGALGATSKLLSPLKGVGGLLTSFSGGLKSLFSAGGAGGAGGGKSLLSDPSEIAKAVASIATILGACVVLALAFGGISAIGGTQILINGAQLLSQLAITLIPALLVFGLATAGLGLLSTLVSPAQVALGLANIAIVIAGFTLLALAIGALASQAGNLLISGAQTLSNMAITIIPALLIFGIATAGLGALGIIPVPLILSGLAGLGLTILALIAFMAIAGVLASIPGFQWLIDQGGKLLVDVAGILGQIIGAFVGAFAGGGGGEAIALILSGIGAGLLALAPGVQAIPGNAGDLLKGLAIGLLALGAGEIIGAIAGLFAALAGGDPLKGLTDSVSRLNQMNSGVAGISNQISANLQGIKNQFVAFGSDTAVILAIAASQTEANLQNFHGRFDSFAAGMYGWFDFWRNLLQEKMNINLTAQGAQTAQSWADGFTNRLNSINLRKSMSLDINVSNSGGTFSAATLAGIKADIKRAVAGGAI